MLSKTVNGVTIEIEPYYFNMFGDKIYPVHISKEGGKRSRVRSTHICQSTGKLLTQFLKGLPDEKE